VNGEKPNSTVRAITLAVLPENTGQIQDRPAQLLDFIDRVSDGSGEQEAGSRKRGAGSGEQEAGSRKQEAGSRKQEEG